MLKQKLILGFSSKIGIQILNLVATVFIARIAGPSVLGTIAFGLAFVNMFQFIGNLGLGGAHAKILNEGYNEGDCIRTFSILFILNKMLFLIFIIVYFYVQKYILKFPFESREQEYVILIFIVMIAFQVVIDIPKNSFFANTEQAKQDIPEILHNLILQPSRIFVVVYGGTALALAAVNLGAVVLMIPLYFYLFRNYPKGRFDKALAMKYLKYGIPLVILGVTMSFAHTLDKVLLQYYTNAQQVGYYTAGFRIGSYFQMIAQSVSMLFYPSFAKAFSQNRPHSVIIKVYQFERFVWIFIAPLIIFVAIYSDSIVYFVLGKGYSNSITTLSVISLSMLAYMLNISYGNIITGMGYFKLASWINVIGLATLVISLYIFINPVIFNFQANGAAWAIFGYNVVIGLLFRLFAKFKLRELNILLYSKYFLFSLLNIFIFYLIYNGPFTLNVNFRLIFPFIYFLLTYSILYLLKMINKNDIKQLISLFRIGDIINYLKIEISK